MRHPVGVLGQLMMSRATTPMLVMFSLGPNYEPTTTPSRLSRGRRRRNFYTTLCRTLVVTLVDLLGTTASPHSIHPPTYRWEPDGAVDL